MTALPPYEPRPGSIPTLPVPDASGWKLLHLVGIGGAGMRSIARFLVARGIAVSGSDLKDSPSLEELRRAGATVFVGHRPEQVGRPDAVVVSSAVPARNPEVRAAEQAGVPVLARAQVLAALMRGYRGVAVAGTHGKTTTTSMIAVTLARAGLSPSFVVGGELNEIGSGAEHGTGDAFVAEADESDGTFLLLEPEVAVVTNVEEDHLTFYADRAEIERAFVAFCRRAGTVVACWDDPGARRVAEEMTGQVRLVRYGESPEVEFRLRDVELNGLGTGAVVEVEGRGIRLQLAVPGHHNLLNACAAIAAVSILGVGPEEAAAAVGTFAGVRRRFERRGEAGGVVFVDDYAHHPTEIAAALRVATGVGRRVVAVCQPLRYSRTQAMWRQLGQSLAAADVVVITDPYAASEDPIPGVTGKLVVDALAEAAPGKRVAYFRRRSEMAPFVADLVRRGDLVITIGGGGDITMVGEEALELVRERVGETAEAAG